MTSRFHFILLSLIFIFGTFLRFYRLGDIPNGYTPDELAQGYTAYSLLQTGKDEWGRHDWLNFRSFGDFKPPLQTWLLIPSVKIFGLTPWAIRLPNALLSSLAIITTYLVTLSLFSSPVTALLAALFLAISPWHLPMSRLGLEANLTVFLSSLGLYLLLTYSHSRQIMALAALIFGLNLFSYHSAKLITPLIVIFTIFYLKPNLRRLQSSYFIFAFIFFLFACLNLATLFQGSAARSSDIAIFKPTDRWLALSQSQYEAIQNGLPSPVSRILNNKVTFILDQFTTNYFSYFSPQFLITTGAGETTYGMIPGFGVLGLAVFVGIIGSLVALHTRRSTSASWLLFIIIVLSPIPASLAKGSYSANRVSIMMPYLQILAASGLIWLGSQFPKHLYQTFFWSALLLLFVFETLNFFQTYFFQGNAILAHGLLYGHRQAIDYYHQTPNIDQVIYSRRLSEPQTYTMFFDRTPPSTVQSQASSWLQYQQLGKTFLDQLPEYKLDKFTFKEINITSDKLQPRTLIIGRPDEFNGTAPDYVIYYPSANELKPAIYLYSTSLHLSS
jgi:4-amino-4-deoxy-L-arabinose transferase-like glycosyltransferase